MHWLHAQRLLLVVYAFGLALAVLESTQPEIRAGRPQGPETFLEPEFNIADVSSALYPDRGLTLYYRAHQAALCDGPAAETPPECRQRDPVEPGEILELLERSVATGNRSIELAMYNYALVLIQENAPPEEIDAAIRNWRITHPRSSRLDPRVMSRKMRQER